MQRLRIVKIGGRVLDNQQKLQTALDEFGRLPQPRLLVHGGGNVANSYLKKLGIVPQMIAGRRITDASTLEVIQMVYAGLLNKNIVARLQGINCPAIGLSGADGNALLAHKRPVGDVDFGLVGDVHEVNAEFIQNLLEMNLSPVFCALTHDGKGQILNTNADTIVASIAAALSPFFEVELFFLFEKGGVLRQTMDENSVIEQITFASYQSLKRENIISAGMRPKLDNAFFALKRGVRAVYILRYDALNYPGKGTRIVL